MGKFTSLPNYPTRAWGSTKVAAGDFFGSNNYQQGGEVQVPATFGFTGIESLHLESAFAYSQNYFARVYFPATGNKNENVAPSYGQNASTANNTNAPLIQWFIAANNAQVANNTDLSAEVVRLRAFGV